MTWLVAGLGNPGERYAKTRHNLGYRVVDELAARCGRTLPQGPIRRRRRVRAQRGRASASLLAKSRAFMNESGPAFASLARKHGVEPDHVIAVHDEIDLPFGALRVKFGGSTAGHNGAAVRSQQRSERPTSSGCGSASAVRPVARSPPTGCSRTFAKREEPDVAILVDDAADAVRSLIADGLLPTQDRYNRSAPREP